MHPIWTSLGLDRAAVCYLGIDFVVWVVEVYRRIQVGSLALQTPCEIFFVHWPYTGLDGMFRHRGLVKHCFLLV